MINNIRNKQHKNRIFAVIIAVIMLIASIFLFTVNVFAAESSNETVSNQEQVTNSRGAYGVSEFNYDAVVNKDHSIDVTEVITITIPEPDTLSSVEFSIPSGNFRVTGLNVENANYSANIVSQGSTITINDQDELTPGVHSFTITYRIVEFADRDESSDLLYLTIMPPEWKQPVVSAEVNVTFPDDFPMDNLKIFAGHLGVQDTTGLLKSEIEGNSISMSGSLLPENFGISLKADLPDGYWVGAIDGIWALFAMLIILGMIALILLLLWFIGGRDPRIKKTYETKPIEGISPVEIGYIINDEFGIRDVVRLILYFGTKGYLQINEYEPKHYRLVRLEEPVDEEKHIRNAYNILFEDVYKGRSIDLEDIGDRLKRMESSLHDAVANGFTSTEMQAATPRSKVFRWIGVGLISIGTMIVNALQYSYQYVSINYSESIIIGLAVGALTLAMCLVDDRKYYSSRTRTGAGQIVLGIISLVVLGRLGFSIIDSTGSILTSIAVMLLLVVCYALIILMRARGKGNAALVMKLVQLRKFIYHPAPKDILENYLADKNYYYDMMIYALMFGAEESWAISFLTLDVPEPDWFVIDIEGNAYANIRSDSTTIDYARDFRAFVSTIISRYQTMTGNRHYR